METPSNTNTLDVLFIRHGLSCTNVIQQYSKASSLSQLQRGVYLDPPLTNWAAQAIDGVTLPPGLKDPDIILSSCLLRATQTALHLFPLRSVVVAPYIREDVPGLANRPATISHQQSVLRESGRRVSYELARQGVTDKFTSEVNSSDYNAFVIWLQQKLPILCAMAAMENKHTVRTIAVVTHGRFMRKFLTKNGKPPTPRNVMMVRQRFQLTEQGVLQLISGLPSQLMSHNDGVVYAGIKSPETLEVLQADGGTINCKLWSQSI